MSLRPRLKSYLIFIPAVLLVLSTFNYAGAATVILNPSQDTYIDQYVPNDLNGSKGHLIARRGGTGFMMNILIEFDLSSLPPGTIINSAKMGLNYWHYNDGDPAGKDLTVHKITNSWDETTATWNFQPGYNPTPFSSQTMPGAYQWVEWDVASEVQAIVNGTSTNYGWEIIDPSSTGYFSMIYFRSNDYDQDIPYLELDTGLTQGWYWKPPYPNYAPSGMPDFDMKQNTWKAIYPGPNGVIDAAVSGDDVYDDFNEMIGPGPDCKLDTEPSLDDYADWCFSGPAAVANCLWWFDSKFGDPDGYPGDMEDRFALVEGYYATGKTVDQEQTLFNMFVDMPPFPPGHVQSFIPDVGVLDAVQILLKFNYAETPTSIEVSIYDALPISPGITPLGTSVEVKSGPWAETWYQFHFEPAITLSPGLTYYLAARPVAGDGNPHWCYADFNPYPSGMAWFCNDNYTLIEQFEADFAFRTEYYVSGPLDDHMPDNVPYLIEDLATRMGTSNSGITDVDSMQLAIDEWFAEKGLAGQFVESTYVAPEFEFIEAEIERSQDVILMLGFYGSKLVDQQQLLWDYQVDLYTWPPGHLQGFLPAVPILDAVQLLLKADAPTPTTVQVDIYNTLPSNPGIVPIGSSIKVVSVPWYAEWFQFHFEPTLHVIPGEPYYIAVRTLDVQNNVEWCYATSDAYCCGEAWMNWDDYTLQQEPFQDFAFKTEYFEEDIATLRDQHFVTCAGVNSDYFQIAFSDPMFDIWEGSMGTFSDHAPHILDPTFHNLAQYVSHDIYQASPGTPDALIPVTWWLPDYPSGYKFTTVEYAVIICPTEECDCQPGNANGDANLNILDITYLISYLYKGGPAPVPYALCSGDPNCDCTVNILDITYLISFLYKSGPAPCTCQQWLAACGPPLRK